MKQRIFEKNKIKWEMPQPFEKNNSISSIISNKFLSIFMRVLFKCLFNISKCRIHCFHFNRAIKRWKWRERKAGRPRGFLFFFLDAIDAIPIIKTKQKHLVNNKDRCISCLNVRLVFVSLCAWCVLFFHSNKNIAF